MQLPFNRTRYHTVVEPVPSHLDLKRDKGLTIRWNDGVESFYPIRHLRDLSPSAEMRELRDQMKRNPLTVLPQSMAGASGPLTATDLELVGNYAVKIRFSDGHDTGIFTWAYLREIDPAQPAAGEERSV